MCKTILVVRDIRKKTSEIGAPSQVQLRSQEILCRPKRQQSLITANQRPNIVYNLAANTINTEWMNKCQQLVLPMCSLVFIVCIYLKTKILRGGMTSLERAFTLHPTVPWSHLLLCPFYPRPSEMAHKFSRRKFNGITKEHTDGL